MNRPIFASWKKEKKKKKMDLPRGDLLNDYLKNDRENVSFKFLR